MKCCNKPTDWRIWIGAVMILLFGSLERDRSTTTAPENQQAHVVGAEQATASPDEIDPIPAPPGKPAKTGKTEGDRP